MLANIYLHYALDQWVLWWRTKRARGEVIAELKQFRAGHRLGGLSIRELIEEGRR